MDEIHIYTLTKKGSNVFFFLQLSITQLEAEAKIVYASGFKIIKCEKWWKLKYFKQIQMLWRTVTCDVTVQMNGRSFMYWEQTKTMVKNTCMSVWWR